MYDTIVIGVDGGDEDRRAISLAHQLITPTARITLVHVSTVTALASVNEGLELELGTPAEGARAFASQLELCGEGTRLVGEHARSVGAGLDAAAARLGADLVVLGPTRTHGLGHLFAGDDVQSTLGQTHCAVAVAVADFGPTRQRRLIRTIGVAYDGSPASRLALAHAEGLARSLDAEVTPMCVVAPHVYSTGFGMVAYPIEDPETSIKAVSAELRALTRRPIEILYGDPIYELERLSARVDLLVCGSRRQGALRRLVLGSTSLALSRSSQCPLIVTPAPETAAPETPEGTERTTERGTAERGTTAVRGATAKAPAEVG